MSGGLDQAFSSISNGLIVFAVAVAASPEAFGLITILMTLLVAVLACLRGGLGIPLLQTANQSATEIRRGGALAVSTALAVSPVLAVVMLTFVPRLGPTAIVLALAAPCVLGQDVLRYVAMTIGRPQVAALWDGIWCLGAFVALGCAWLRLPYVNPATILASWGLLALVGAVAMAISLRVTPTMRGFVEWIKYDWQHRVRFAVDAGLEQTGILVVFVLVTALMSADATGALRGAMALFAPIGIFGAAVQIVLIPESVRSSATPRRVWRVLVHLVIWTALATAALGLVFYLIPPDVGFYLLGESFIGAQHIIIPTTAWFVAACFSVVQSLFLRTFNKSRRVLTMKITYTVGQLVAAAVAAVLFRSAYGIATALAIQTLATAMFFLFVWAPWRLEVGREEPSDVAVEDPVSPARPPMIAETSHRTAAPLAADALREALVGPDCPWRRLDIVEETGSTNADLLARAASGEDIDGVVLIAEHQTAGRGRLGRSWVDTPRAQVALSVGVDASAVPTEKWGLLPLAAGVAVVDAVTAETGVPARLKWPNDVLVDDAKLAGILAEVAPAAQSIVVGVGLNVTLSPQESGQPNATSLRELGVRDPDRDRLARRLLFELARRIAEWRQVGGDDTLARDYRARCATLGTLVRVTLPGGTEVVGTATSVDEQGRLILDIPDADGRPHAVTAGDVVHLRPV